MKITVGENERAFLFRNGRFVRMLGTGKHWLFRFLGDEVRRLGVNDEPLNAEDRKSTRLNSSHGS